MVSISHQAMELAMLDILSLALLLSPGPLGVVLLSERATHPLEDSLLVGHFFADCGKHASIVVGLEVILRLGNSVAAHVRPSRVVFVAGAHGLASRADLGTHGAHRLHILRGQIQVW